MANSTARMAAHAADGETGLFRGSTRVHVGYGLHLLFLLTGCVEHPRPEEMSDAALVAAFTRVCDQVGLRAGTERPVVALRTDYELWRAASVKTPKAEMWIDVATGELRLLRQQQSFHVSLLGQWDVEPIPDTRAEEVAMSWLEKLRPWCLEHVVGPAETIVFRSTHRSQLMPGWTVEFAKSHDGFEVSGGVEVTFLDDGTLVSFQNDLPRVDCPTDVNVSERKARETARNALPRATELYGTSFSPAQEFFGNVRTRTPSDSTRVPLRIVCTTRLLEDRNAYEDSIVRAQPSRLRLAYVFQFAHSNPIDREFVALIIYVDARTGECVGGHIM